MRLVHYTSIAQLALILRSGKIAGSWHEGFAQPMVSFVPDGAPPLKMFWLTGMGTPHRFTTKGLARVVIDAPGGAERWAKACRVRKLVTETARREEGCRDWRVIAGDVDLALMQCAQVEDPDEGWLTIDLPTINLLVNGFRYMRIDHRGNKTRVVL